MKRIFLLLLFIVALFTTRAQQIIEAQRVNVLNNLGLPLQDTIAIPYKIGEIRIRPQDSTAYKYNGKTSTRRWNRLGAIDAITALNDSTLRFIIDGKILDVPVRGVSGAAGANNFTTNQTFNQSTEIITLSRNGLGTIPTDLSGTWPKIQRFLDSCAALRASIGTGGSGVTNVATNSGTGITGGPITSTGTLALDTANKVTSKDSRKKLGDSLGLIIAGKQAILALTTTGTSGAATLTGATLNIPQYLVGGSTDTSWLSKRIDWKPRVFNIDSLGGKGDARTVFDMNFTNGSTNIISPTANFTSADIGKHGWSPHAGVAGKGLPFNIVGVTNSTTATISPAASATFSADTVSFGTDNTTATLAALNAVAAAGGGQVYIPSGTRVFSGPLLTSVNGVNPNCILPIPDASIGANFNSRTVIEIVGEIGGNSVTQARLGDSIVQHTGTTLLIQTHGSGQAPALFGTKGRQGSFNYNRIVFSNLNIIAPWNGDTKGPDIGAINCFYCALPDYENVVAVVDHSLYASDTPTNNMCAAIITNGNGGETKINVNGVMVGGYRFGIVSGDHVYAPDLIIQGCHFGITLPLINFPFTSPKTITHWTPFSVYSPTYDLFGGLIPHGVSYADIKMLELEPLDVGTWREYQAVVVDSANNIASSEINFHFLTGHERQFKRIGAANVNAVALGTYGNKISSDTTNLLIGDSATHKAWQTFEYDLGGSAVTQYDAHNVPVFVNVIDNNGNTAGTTGAMSGRQNYFYDVPANKFVSYYNSRQQFILGESLLNYGMLINPSVGKGRMSTLTPNGNFVLGDSSDVFGLNKGYSAWAPTGNADIMLFNDGGIASNKGGLIRKLPSSFSAPLGSGFAFFNQDNAPLYFGIGTHINAINFTSGNWTIGQDSLTDIPSALLNMQSVQKGFRAPAMTATQRNAISSPADGLLIYNKTDTCYSYYKGGIGWVNLIPGSGGSSYTLPTASTTVLGGVKVDGISVIIAGGIISATGASPAGSANQLQYNGGGVFQANANFTVDPSNGFLGVGKSPLVSLDVQKDQNASTGDYLANLTTGIHARAIKRTITDAGLVQFGINSIANTDDFGNIIHGSSYIYSNSATNFVIASDDAAAPILFQIQTAEKMRLSASGRLGIGVTAPTAFAHLAAATTGAASLRLQSSAGINVSSPNSGDLWWTGTQLYFRTGSSTVDLLAGGSSGTTDSINLERIGTPGIPTAYARDSTFLSPYIAGLNSVNITAGSDSTINVKLVNDTAIGIAANYYYGTNVNGRLGFYANTAGVTTMGTFGSTPNSNGGSISGSTLTLQPANGSNPGGVSTTTQTFAGAKTFANNVSIPHIISTGSTPGIAAGSGAGTSPTISITGTDMAGTIILTAGTTPTAGQIIGTITFNTVYGTAPIVVLQPANMALGSGTIFPTVSVASSTTVFTFYTNSITGLASSTHYEWNYIVVQ